MEYRDLRDWIERVRDLGELREVRGATWEEDIGRITEMLHHTDDSPAVLFDDIPGYPSGFRILANANATRKRLALTLGLPVDIERRPLMDRFLELTETSRAIPPRVVKDGPVMENVARGGDVDVLKFPSPQWHPLDGGRYLGTGVVDVLKDPDSDWVNLGTYRVMVHDAKRVGVYISPGKHGRQFRDVYFKRKEPCPILVVCGVDPLLFIASTLEVPQGVSEYDWAGGIRGEPYEVITEPVTGLPMPASAEIVLAGFLHQLSRIFEKRAAAARAQGRRSARRRGRALLRRGRLPPIERGLDRAALRGTLQTSRTRRRDVPRRRVSRPHRHRRG